MNPTTAVIIGAHTTAIVTGAAIPVLAKPQPDQDSPSIRYAKAQSSVCRPCISSSVTPPGNIYL